MDKMHLTRRTRAAVGRTLNLFGIRKSLAKARRFLSDELYRRNCRGIEKDYWDTRRALGSFMRQGTERADRDRQVLIISMSNLPVLIKFHGLLAKALQLRGYEPVVLTYSGCRYAPRYLHLFGITDIVFWDEYVKRHAISGKTVNRIVDSLLAEGPTIRDIKGWEFHGVNIGKHALSSTARKRLQGQFDLSDPDTFRFFRNYVVRAIDSVFAAERFLDSRPIQRMIVRDAGYVPNGAVYEVGLVRGVDALRCEMGQRRGSWIFKRYTAESRGQSHFSLSPLTWEQLRTTPLTPEQEEAREENFIERYDPGSYLDVNLYQYGKCAKTPDEVRAALRLDPGKKTAVVFSHISWDASFFDGEDLYDDYEHWLVETTRLACANPDLNWIIKLHPANVFKLQREDRQSEETEMIALRRLGELPSHVHIMHASTDINTRSLFPLIDYGITVRGTIGMELPCFGIPVLTAGTGRYDGYGFTLDSSTREEYEQRLLMLHTLPRLGPDQVELARRHAYWTLVRRQTSFEDITPMTTKQVTEAQCDLHTNVSIRAQSLKEFESAASVRAFADWATDGVLPDLIF